MDAWVASSQSLICVRRKASPAQEAGTAGEHCPAAVRARALTGTPALHRLAKVRECFMPYWSRGPQPSSHAATIACAASTPHVKA